MKKIITICFLSIVAGNCFGQQVTFQKTFGGIHYEGGTSVQQTSDGGYIIAGDCSNNALNGGNSNIYLIKTDAIGDTLWTKIMGLALNDAAYCVQQTTDGGYIITGYGFDTGGSFTDVYLYKTDANGNYLWIKTYGGLDYDVGRSVKQTSDGGYIIAGYTQTSFNGDNDLYLIKTDANGNMLWSKSYGGVVDEVGYSVQQTTDGGYIITGTISSSGSYDDVYLVKTDSNGNLLWSKEFGGIWNDGSYSVQQTIDGGYIIAGYIHMQIFASGHDVVYLIKTDASGNLLWSKTFFGGTYNDYGYSVQQTTDNGYIVGGSIWNFSGNNDVYLIKTDINGDTLWTKTFGGVNSDEGYSVHQTIDGGYIILGRTFSFGADSGNVYLIKTDSMGNSGCYEVASSTIVTIPATQVTNPVTIVTSSATIVNSPFSTNVSSGGTVTTLCTTVGIAPIFNFQFSIFNISPNPATNNFTITFPNTLYKGVIEIYNVMGEKIFNKNIVNVSQKEIRLNNINAGIYFVKVKGGEKEYTKKLVIE